MPIIEEYMRKTATLVGDIRACFLSYLYLAGWLLTAEQDTLPTPPSIGLHLLLNKIVKEKLVLIKFIIISIIYLTIFRLNVVRRYS